MSVVVSMEQDPHVAAQALLPWYARGQLAQAEMQAVQSHLLQCAACRAELDAERPMQALLSLPAAAPAGGDAEAALARLRGRIKAEAAPAVLRPARWMPWALGLQGCAIAALLVLVVLPRPEAPAYRGLSAPAQSDGVEALIMFGPDVREQRIRELLRAHGASLVGGPTDSGAYRLRLVGGAPALAALRAEPGVSLLESLEAGARR
jgi:anti-sigma factor RsiW